MKKIISLVIVLMMVMAFASTAFATTKTNATLSTSGSSDTWHGMTISRDAWTTSGGTWKGSTASGVTLTVRPHSDDVNDYNLSLAYSYSATKLNGGQTYELLAYPIYVKYNTNTSGTTAALQATWYF